MSDPESVVRIPPRGIDPELNDEIMRRIRNRNYDGRGGHSLGRGKAGLKEMAGILPIVSGMPKSAIRYYALEIAKIRHLFDDCLSCKSKLFALIYLLLHEVEPEKHDIWLRRVQHIEDLYAEREDRRNFVAEVLEASKICEA